MRMRSGRTQGSSNEGAFRDPVLSSSDDRLAHPFDETIFGPAPLTATVTTLLIVWSILFVVGTFPALMLTGMAFEGGHTLDAYVSLVAVWSYPPLVGIAFYFRRRKPALVWLPLMTMLLLIAEQVRWDLGHHT